MHSFEEMWLIALAIWLACKWLSWRQVARENASFRSASRYFLGWPGMDARPFVTPSVARVSNPCRDAALAGRSTRYKPLLHIATAILLIVCASRLVVTHPLAAGWLGMIGTVLLLHFGLFESLARAWRAYGVDVEPIMQSPTCATSLADFWSRWNRGFRDLAFRLIFRPLHRRIGVVGATLATFLFSGIVHDLVISVPARGGFGLPTLYFLIQGFGILFEKSRVGRGTHPAIIRTLMYVALLAPLPLLFHRAFVLRVYVPFILELGRCHMTPQILVSLLRIGGLMHFGILIASALTPRVLDWKRELQKLTPLTRQLVWVHGIFIVVTIVGLGVIATVNAPVLATGNTLARFVCGFIALFWLARVSLQFVLFDPREYLKTRLLKFGYHGLTFVFAYIALVFGLAAINPL